ncbi:hypothetical protein GCM10020000_84640 [Streptomyces olivoverticillatus]
MARAQLAPPVWRAATSFAEAFPRITRPHPLQADLGQRLPGLVTGAGLLVVTAPTGDGKTEAGLYGARVLGAAASRQGLGVLLPTMAMTEAMWSRVRQYVASSTTGEAPVTLLHSLAWLNADYSDPDADAVIEDGCASTTPGEFLRRKHLGLLSGVAVGTWDQAAMAALPVRFNALRWLGLAGKTLIIDEAHAYDAYGHALTIRLLEWCGHLGIPVVLLSATLSGSLAQRLVAAYLTGAQPHPGQRYHPRLPRVAVRRHPDRPDHRLAGPPQQPGPPPGHRPAQGQPHPRSEGPHGPGPEPGRRARTAVRRRAGARIGAGGVQHRPRRAKRPTRPSPASAAADSPGSSCCMPACRCGSARSSPTPSSTSSAPIPHAARSR